MNRYILIISFFFLLLGCGAQKQDVSGTDTGNPVIQAVVSDSNGVALWNAKVIVYSPVGQDTSLRRIGSGQIGLVISDTLLTDSEGRVNIPSSSADKIGVEVYWNDALGIYTSISPSKGDAKVLLTALPLVDFPTNADLVLSNTGRRLPAGSVTKIPPGLWEIRYVRFGSQDTLPPLQVRIEDAAKIPEALQSLNLAATELAKKGVKPLGYVEFADYPQEPSIVSKIEFSCASDGYQDVLQCKEDKGCHVWQWQSDWVAGSDNVSVLAGALTLNGEILCVLFPDQAISGRPVFYSFSEVRQIP